MNYICKIKPGEKIVQSIRSGVSPAPVEPYVITPPTAQRGKGGTRPGVSLEIQAAAGRQIPRTVGAPFIAGLRAGEGTPELTL